MEKKNPNINLYTSYLLKLFCSTILIKKKVLLLIGQFVWCGKRNIKSDYQEASFASQELWSLIHCSIHLTIWWTSSSRDLLGCCCAADALHLPCRTPMLLHKELEKFHTEHYLSVSSHYKPLFQVFCRICCYLSSAQKLYKTRVHGRNHNCVNPQ